MPPNRSEIGLSWSKPLPILLYHNINPKNHTHTHTHSYKDVPGHPLRCTFEGSLKDLLVYTKPKGVKKIFYQRLSMNIDELESKKQFKCLWLSIDMKVEKELVLFPNKNGTVRTLLEEARKQVEFNRDIGSGLLRIVEVSNCKLLQGPMEDDLLECKWAWAIPTIVFHR